MHRTFFAGAAVAALMLIAGGAASAATIMPISTGPFSLANSVGTIDAFKATVGETYDFTFSTTNTFRVLSQLQASSFTNGSEPIDFTVFKGLPGSGVSLGSTSYTTGPSLGLQFGAGDYYIETGTIAFNTELVSGGIKLLTAAVPEPSTWGMMLLGLGAIGAVLRRAKRKYGVSLGDAFKAAPTV